jgi:hypothetical protein
MTSMSYVSVSHVTLESEGVSWVPHINTGDCTICGSDDDLNMFVFVEVVVKCDELLSAHVDMNS